MSTWAVVLALLATAGVLEGLLALGSRGSRHDFVPDAATSLAWRTALAALVALLALPVGLAAARDVRFEVTITVVVASLLAFGQTFLLLSERLRQNSLARILQPTCFVTGLLIWTPTSFGAVIRAFLLSQVLALLGTLLLLGRESKRVRLRTAEREFRRYVRVAQVTPAAALVAARADLLVLGAVLPAAAFGNYAIAASITSIIAILLSGVTPLVVKRAAAGTLRARHAAEAVTAFAVLAVALLTGISFVAVPLVYGTGFGDAPLILCLLAPGAVASAISTYCTAVLQGRGLPGAPSSFQLIAATVSPAVLWVAGATGGVFAGALASSSCAVLLATALVWKASRAPAASGASDA